MCTVDVMMTADFTEMAMVVFSAEPLPVPMTMVPFTILRRNIITGYWSVSYTHLLDLPAQLFELCTIRDILPEQDHIGYFVPVSYTHLDVYKRQT